MEKLEKFTRAVFFSIFAAIGIVAIALAILGPEWKNLYKIKAATKQSEQNNAKIERILRDQQELVSLINREPNILERLAPAAGRDPHDSNVFAAQLTADTLVQAKAVLDQSGGDENQNFSDPQIPAWLLRATLKSSRIVLFSSGAGLVLVSFVCFSSRRFAKPDANRKNKT